MMFVRDSNNNKRKNTKKKKKKKKNESFNTSSGSSSGYNSQFNLIAQQHQHEGEESQYRNHHTNRSCDLSPPSMVHGEKMGRRSLAGEEGGERRHLGHLRAHLYGDGDAERCLSVSRTQMLPVMIDDDDDKDDDEEEEDELAVERVLINECCGVEGANSSECADSSIFYHHHHHLCNHLYDAEGVDSRIQQSQFDRDHQSQLSRQALDATTTCEPQRKKPQPPPKSSSHLQFLPQSQAHTLVLRNHIYQSSSSPLRYSHAVGASELSAVASDLPYESQSANISFTRQSSPFVYQELNHLNHHQLGSTSRNSAHLPRYVLNNDHNNLENFHLTKPRAHKLPVGGQNPSTDSLKLAFDYQLSSNHINNNNNNNHNSKQPTGKSRATKQSKSMMMMANGARQATSATGGAASSQHLSHAQQQHAAAWRSSSSAAKRKRGHLRGHRNKSRSRVDSPSGDHANNGRSKRVRLGCCGSFGKMLLFVSNLLFWSAGLALAAWGVLSLVDEHKYSLSQLVLFDGGSRMSLFQLLAWSFITLGCATVLVGLCGCSAIIKNNRWILGLYIFLILAIFALDLATGLLAIIFQERLIANVRLRLVGKLRSDYGVQAAFTTAIDYIQTKFECCGVDGHFDYDQSTWRLQRLGGFEATVARTCCHLRNTFDDHAHINPRPVNESLCQSSDVRFHQSYRYRKGCMDDLERLVRQRIWTFTLGCGVVGAIIILSLLFATCYCRSISKVGSRKGSASHKHQLHHQHTNIDDG